MAEPKKIWTESELRVLQQLALRGYPSSTAAARLGRSLTAVQRKAATHGISFGGGRPGRR